MKLEVSLRIYGKLENGFFSTAVRHKSLVRRRKNWTRKQHISHDPTTQKWWRTPTLTDTGIFLLFFEKGCNPLSQKPQRKEKITTHVPEEFDVQALEKEFELECVWMKEDEKVDGLRSCRELLIAVNDALLREAILDHKHNLICRSSLALNNEHGK